MRSWIRKAVVPIALLAVLQTRGFAQADATTMPASVPDMVPATTDASDVDPSLINSQPFPPLGAAGRLISRPLPPAVGGGDFLPLPDRYRIGTPADYQSHVTRGALYDPYNQNVLKGDYPILLKKDFPFLESDLFFVADATSDTLFETRRLPVPAGVSTASSGQPDFFGSGRQFAINQNLVVTAEIFEGDAGYKPRDLDIRFTPVFNLNYVHVDENELINPDPREGRDRTDGWIGIQEAFIEKHLADVSPNYDFVSVRAGIQGFTSDFRGYLFSDNEPGVRVFGTFDNNKLQYNLVWLHSLEKDTNSGLNSYTSRDQDVFIANVYRQDFLFPGYTAQLSFHTNLDNGDGSDGGVPRVQLDDNGVIVRPSPIGTIHENDIRAYYLGWAGDGHIGRFNLSHQFYQVFGNESFNPIAGKSQQINAQFFAIDLSYDQDYIRYHAGFLWASGDSNPTDGTARGFDSIFDNPNFAGGDFSFFTRQAIKLTGTGVNLVNRNSLLPDLRTSKEEGQANFVNPGIFIYNLGLDTDITPKLKAIMNVSYLQFDDADVLRTVLQDNHIDNEIGIDYSIGLEYRPFLNNNAIFTFGAAALQPMGGFDDIYNSRTLYSIFTSATLTF